MPIYKTGKSKDGKQQYRVFVSYTTPGGEYRKKSKTVYGSIEAKTAEAQLLADLGGDVLACAKMTVGELFEDYIKNKKSEVRETSLNKTIGVLRVNVLPHLEKVRIDKLDIKRLQEWKNKINERDVSLVTKQNAFCEFRAMLNYAVKMEHLPSNPLQKVGNFKEVYFAKPQDKLHYYTPEQFKRYIAVAESHMEGRIEQGMFAFFNIAFYTGMRKGEINALKWSDIDGDIIHVRRSVAQKIKGTSILETPPKNRSSYRDLQMPKCLAAVLEEHKKRQYERDENFSDEYRVCGGISILSDSYIDAMNRRYADEAGLPHIRIHDFRHSHASVLANEGINIQEIARRLGHSKIETTWNTYSHLYPREEERAVKILDNL